MEPQTRHVLLVSPGELLLPLTLEPSPPALLEAGIGRGDEHTQVPNPWVGVLGLGCLSRATRLDHRVGHPPLFPLILGVIDSAPQRCQRRGREGPLEVHETLAFLGDPETTTGLPGVMAICRTGTAASVCLPPAPPHILATLGNLRKQRYVQS